MIKPVYCAKMGAGSRGRSAKSPHAAPASWWAGRQSLGNGVVRPKPSGLVAIPSWARPSVVAGGATCALKRALVQAGIEAKSARQSHPFCLVRTAGDDGCSAPAATRGGRRLLFCGGTNCDVGFHILRRHQTNLVAEPCQLTCPLIKPPC